MAEKKNDVKTETPKSSDQIPHDPNAVENHLQRIAKALERLADAFAPFARKTIPGRPLARTCSNGHGMQPTDDYCQTCFREQHVSGTVTVDGAPNGAKLPDEVA